MSPLSPQPRHWPPWQRLLAASLTRPEELADHFGLDPEPLRAVVARYPLRINPYYLSLIATPGDPIWRQAVPDPLELHDTVCPEDPLDEENFSPVPNLVHKYPDRALLLVTGQCAMYCRFCTRKRKVGTAAMISATSGAPAPGRSRLGGSRDATDLAPGPNPVPATDLAPVHISGPTFGLAAGLAHGLAPGLAYSLPPGLAPALAYLTRTPAIHDVLISGGDPLLLPDDQLVALLTELRRIPHLEIIRIGSRVPCTLPQRVTARLAGLLKKFHPLYLNTHFNHPREITPEATLACRRLADAGIPLGNQTVLLKGVNDDAATIKTLMRELLRIRVKPYYLFQGDLSRGTDHFRTPVERGQQIMRELIGHTSGLATPTLALDAPGGMGKIPLTPDYIQELTPTRLLFTNHRGRPCHYPNPD